MIAFELAYDKPPLSLNDRSHWAAKARLTRQVRAEVHSTAAWHRIPPQGAVTVTLHYQPRDNRRRDKDNLFATLKPCIDGLRDAGVIADDDSTRVEPRVVIHPANGEPALWITVEPLEQP